MTINMGEGDAVNDRNNWRPLPYRFDYTNDSFEDNKWHGVISFWKWVSFDVMLERDVPTKVYWEDDTERDARSQRQKRNDTWYVYKVTLKWTDIFPEHLESIGYKPIEQALDELAAFITLEMEELSDDKMSAEIADLVQVTKLQAEMV